MCHNDVCPENVVFRDGIAVALLDFEFAAPCGCRKRVRVFGERPPTLMSGRVVGIGGASKSDVVVVG